MSLDSALRQGLLAAGDSITADTTYGIDGVVHRIKRRRKRQVATGVVVAFSVLVLVISDRTGERLIDAIPDVPPAREHHERNDGTGQEQLRRAVVGSDPTSADRSSQERVRPGVAATGSSFDGDAQSRSRRVENPIVASAFDPRTVEESYKIARAAGTHMGENAGLGCTEGPGVTGADDCFHIEVGADENSLLIEIEDDAGVVVPFSINEHHQGDSRDLGSFCGTTSDRITVQPGAVLLVSIDGGNQCSDRAPTSGRLLAHFWKA